MNTTDVLRTVAFAVSVDSLKYDVKLTYTAVRIGEHVVIAERGDGYIAISGYDFDLSVKAEEIISIGYESESLIFGLSIGNILVYIV